MRPEKIPRPLRDFLIRAADLKNEHFETGLTADTLIDKRAEGRGGNRDILNYGYALLGAGTLLVRFLAVIVMRRYFTTRLDSEPSAVFHRLILEHLHDRLPLDSSWVAVLKGGCRTLENDSWEVIRRASQISEQARFLDDFVTIRNKFVHEDLPESPDALLNYIKHLESVADSLSIFEDCSFDETDGQLMFTDAAGESLSLHPFVRSGQSTEGGVVVPYLFQGLYEGRSVLKLLGTEAGDELEHKRELGSWSDLDAQFRILGRQALGLQNEFDFKALIDRYQAMFVGRDREMEALQNFCEGKTAERYLAVHAAAGMGKSALLAHLARRLDQAKHPVIFHFCGSGEANNPLSVLAGLISRGRKGIDGDSLWKNQPDALQRKQSSPPGSYEPMVTLFQDTLSAYVPSKKSSGKNLIVIIDGVDQAFVSHPDLPLSAIFTRKEKSADDEITAPFDIPENVRIIFGYRTGKVREAGKSAAIPGLQPLQPLGADSVDLAFRESPITPEVKSALLHFGRPMPAVENEGRIDPSYLRFVYDEMSAGRLSRSNAASIPRGLAGLFERELSFAENIAMREQRLQVFTAFALAQRAVSISFIAAVLSQEEESVRAVVERYASWFNAEEGRRIALSHERLRLFFLQRVSERELLSVNEKFLSLCRKWDDLTDSEEKRYALEFLARHLVIAAEATEVRPYPRSLEGNPFAVELCDLVLNEAFRDAQIAATSFYNHSINDAVLAVEYAVRATAGLAGEFVDTAEILQTGNLPTVLRLSLQAELVFSEAQQDFSNALKWVEAGDMGAAIECADVLSDEQKRFFLQFILLWATVDSEALTRAKRIEMAKRLLAHMDATIPKQLDVVDYGGWIPTMDWLTWEWPSWLKVGQSVSQQGLAVIIGALLSELHTWGLDIIPFFERGSGVIRDEVLKYLCTEATSGAVDPSILLSLIDSGMEVGDNEITCTVCEALARTGEMSRALAVARGVADGEWKARALGRLAQREGQEELLAEATHAARSIKGDDEARHRALAEIAVAHHRLRHTEDAHQLLLEVEGDFLRSPRKQRRVSGPVLSRAWKDLGATNRILGLLPMMPLGPARITMQADAGDLMGAGRAAQRLRSAQRVSALSLVAKLMIKMHNTEQATPLLLAALDSASRINDELQRLSAFAEVAPPLALCGRHDEAVVAFGEALGTVSLVEDDMDKALALGVLVASLPPAFPSRHTLFGEARDIVTTIDDELSRAVGLILLGIDRAKEGHRAEARRTLMQAVTSIPEDSDDLDEEELVPIQCYLRIHAMKGSFRRVATGIREMASGLPDKLDRCFLLIRIAELTRLRDCWPVGEILLDEARSLAQRLKHRSDSIAILGGCAALFARVGDSDGATRIVEEMTSLAETPGPDQTPSRLLALVTMYASQLQFQEVVSALAGKVTSQLAQLSPEFAQVRRACVDAAFGRMDSARAGAEAGIALFRAPPPSSRLRIVEMDPGLEALKLAHEGAFAGVASTLPALEDALRLTGENFGHQFRAVGMILGEAIQVLMEAAAWGVAGGDLAGLLRAETSVRDWLRSMGIAHRERRELVSIYRRQLRWFPFQGPLPRIGVRPPEAPLAILVRTLAMPEALSSQTSGAMEVCRIVAECGELETLRAIARACPQLGLAEIFAETASQHKETT